MARRSTLVARRLSKAIKNDVFAVDGQIASAGVSANQYDSLAALPLTGIAAGTKAFVEDSDRLYISNGTGWYSITLTNASPSITSVLDSDGGITPFTLATDGSATVITVAATDSDGTPLTYNYSVSSGSLNGSTVTQDSSVFTVTPHDSNATTFDLTFTATDGINTATSGANSFILQFSIWNQQAKIQSSDIAAHDYFGADVSISNDGNTAIVGAYGEDTTASRAGSVYIFTRSGTTWTQQAKLQASDAATDDFLGWSVSISNDGNTAIAAARKADYDPWVTNSGAAYIFTRSGTSWSQQAKLEASDAELNDYFGHSVSISGDGDTAIIGAPDEDISLPNEYNSGSAYIFTRSGTSWSQQAKIRSTDIASQDQFGYSVSISNDGDTAIIGAYFEDTSGFNAGSAYIFTRSGTSWSQQAKIQASDAQGNDQFGKSVYISGDGNTAISSAYLEDTTASNAGSTYIFTRSGTNWSQQAKIQAEDADASDGFGTQVCISNDGNTAVISATTDEEAGAAAGSAYVFIRSGTTWSQQSKIIGSDTEASDYYGIGVSISGDGDTIIIGAQYEDTNGANAGSVYIFSN
jgi:hypothetical protein